MYNSFGVGAARRVRRAAALLGVLVAGAAGAGMVIASPAAAAEPVPTMTFKGSLNVLGLLNSLTVTPASVSVPAGGKVTFVNSSPNALKLTIGGREFPTLAKGASLPLVFQGAANSTTSQVKASPLGGVVGGLVASTGSVNVAAAPRTPPKSDSPAPDPTKPSGSPQPGTPNTPGGPTQPQNGGVVPQVLPGDGVKLPPNFGRDPVARGGMASAGLPPMTEAEAGMAPSDTIAAPERAKRADNKAKVDGEITTVGGGIGLLILVATVLLGGVGAAAIRTVLAQRGAEMRS